MDAQQRVKQLKQTFIIFGSIIYVLVAFYLLHVGHMATDNVSVASALTLAINHMLEKPMLIFPIYTWQPFIYGSIGYLLTIMYVFLSERRKDVDRDASGNAKWNTNIESFNKKYNEPFGNGKKTDGYTNTILGKGLYLSMNGSKTMRNAHKIIFGGSGAGKSYSIVKPNALQMNSSFIFTDPKGELLEELAHPLQENGYEIKVFNLTEMHKSMCYNPYNYIRDENGVRKMVKCIIDNTRGTDEKSGDPIWEDSMTALLQAISFYLIEKCPPEERNFTNVMRMLRLAQIDENNTSAKSPFDLMFEKLEQENPESMAVMSYKTFRIGSGNTLKSILITTMTRLDVFNMQAVANLTCRDTIALDEVGSKRQALFIIIPAEDKTFNFLAATMYTQLFENLYHQVENEFPDKWLLQKGNDTYLTSFDKEELELKQKLIAKAIIKENKQTERFEVLYQEDGKPDTFIQSFTTKKSAQWFIDHAKDGCKINKGSRTLPYDVQFMLDEFANVGKIPGFVEKLSTMRSYKIWCTIILQNLGQLKKMWGDDMNTIIGNCDTFIFLGSQEKDMIEYIQTMLGKTTKRQKSTSLSYGKGGGSESFQYTGANLLDFNEIREMGDFDSIVFLRGERPFKVKKFNLKEHKNYNITGNAHDEFKWKNELDNRKVVNPKRDKKQAVESKQKRYEKDIEQNTPPISEAKDAGEVLAKACENNLEELKKRILVDENEEDLDVASTESEKEIAQSNYEASEQELEDLSLDGDLWDMLGSSL